MNCSICHVPYAGNPCGNCGAVLIYIYKKNHRLYVDVKENKHENVTKIYTASDQEIHEMDMFDKMKVRDILFLDRGILLKNGLILLHRVRFYVETYGFEEYSESEKIPYAMAIGDEIMQ